MQYNFDEIIERAGTNCVKYDGRKSYFGTDKLIPMWVADMDFRIPSFITEAIIKRASHDVYGYFLKPESYYQSIVDWMKSRHQWEIEKDWIVFAPGIVPALNMAVLAYTKPGDRIIVQPPVYFPFFSAISDHERQISYNQLKIENSRYLIDYEHLESIIDAQTRMLILCSPHNPVGRVWTTGELKRLASICMKHNLLILSDEIHADLVYSGYRHTPIASLSEEIRKVTVTFAAPSKTFNLAALAASSLIIPNKDLREAYCKVMNNLHVGSGNIFGVVASEAAYRNGSSWLDELMKYLRGNLDYLEEFLHSKLLRVKMISPEATYLVWLDFRELGLTQEKLKNFLIYKAGIGLNDGSTFGPGGEGYMRINIACRRQLLAEALNKLESAFKEHFIISE